MVNDHYPSGNNDTIYGMFPFVSFTDNQELHSFATGDYYYLKVEDELVKMGFAHSKNGFFQGH